MARKKKNIISLLEAGNYPALTDLILRERKVITLLLSLTYDKKSSLSWRAMEIIGIATAEIAKSDRDGVRDIANRLLWMMRDESGGIAWSNAEILGEIVRNNPVLCADLAPIIMSFHEELMFTAGVLRAMGRIGRLNDDLYNYATPVIRSLLIAEDDQVRGYGAWALGEMHCSEAEGDLKALRADAAVVDFYEAGSLVEKTVGELAQGALKILSESSEDV